MEHLKQALISRTVFTFSRRWGQASLIFPESTVAYEPAIYAEHVLGGLRRLRKTFYLQVWCEIDLEVVGMKRSSHLPSDAEHRRSLIDHGIN
jgi:hypothetical protein